MKAADLAKVWGAPDNSRLTAKQQSFRLPTHVAAKINALCDVFPNRTKTEIVGDLLAAALDDVIRNLPVYPTNEEVSPGPDGERMFAAWGPKVDFERQANRHFRALEKELGNNDVTDLYTAKIVTEASAGDAS
jgi:hypothetical protein